MGSRRRLNRVLILKEYPGMSAIVPGSRFAQPHRHQLKESVSRQKSEKLLNRDGLTHDTF